MTSLQDHAQDLFSMADDDMEISSDVGQQDQDGDIDIDIDFTNERHEEDSILEDAEPDADYEEGNDHLMVDDENQSYTMNDIDIVTEDDAGDDGGHIDVSDMVAANSAGIEMEQPERLYVEDAEIQYNGISDIGWDEAHASDDIVELADHKEILSEQMGETAPEPAPTNTEYLSPTAASTANDSAAQVEPLESTPNILATAVEEALAADAISSEEVEDKGEAGLQDDSTSTAQPLVANEPVQSNARVVVHYQDAEYALISNAESDDPDTFFFRDYALATNSLQSFFQGLRDVVHEDLSIDDELSIAVEDLGIEIDESTAASFEVTFADIVVLYQTLVRNDGVELPGPLHISLGAKPNYHKRLASLMLGSTQGKGLSELVSYEESEGLDTEEETKDLDDGFSSHEATDAGLAFEEEPQVNEHDPNSSESNLHTSNAQVPDAFHEGSVDGGEPLEQPQDQESIPVAHEEDNAAETEADHKPGLVDPFSDTQKSATEGNENELIDYGFDGPTGQEQTEPTFEIAQPQESTDNTGDFPEQAVDEADTTTRSENDVLENEQTEDPDTYPEESLYDEEDISEHVESHEGGEAHLYDENDGGNGEANAENDDAGLVRQGDSHPDQTLQADSTSNQENYDVGEVDFDLGAPKTDAEDMAINPSQPSPVAENALEEDEINYDDDVEVPESNGSEPTLVGDDIEQAPEASPDDDEIDYEDDESEPVTVLSGETNMPPNPDAHNGKRSRVEAVGMEAEDQASKRARSEA